MREFLHERAKKANNGRDPHEPIDYRGQLVGRWADVVVAAWSNRQPASLEVVIPRLEGVAFNRRYWMKDGSVGWIPRKGDTNIFRPAGPVDTDFPFLFARDAASRNPLGALSVFAMHTAVYGGPPFGADFPGHLQTNLTARVRTRVHFHLRRRLRRRRESPEPIQPQPAALDQRLARNWPCDGARWRALR